MLSGARERCSDDDTLLAHVGPLLDDLYQAYRSTDGSLWSGSRQRPWQRLMSQHGLRAITLDRHSLSPSHLASVVEDGTVLGAAIVPESHRVGSPLHAHLELRCLLMTIEELQQGLALRMPQLDDLTGEPPIDEQALSPGFRMAADHRVQRLGVGSLALDAEAAAVLSALIAVVKSVGGLPECTAVSSSRKFCMAGDSAS